jgi:quercetin dioxygenase-like cupin family protein
MRTKRRILVSVIGMVGLGVGVLPQAVQSAADEPIPPIAVEVLAGHSTFPDDVSLKLKRRLTGDNTEVLNVSDQNTIVVARLAVQPGAQFPWHTHPGPAVASIVSGDLVYQQESDCIERRYMSGQSFIDPGNSVHTAWNAGTEPTVIVVTFYGVPDGGAVTIPEQDQTNRCE